MRHGSTVNADIIRLDTFILVQSRDIAIVCELHINNHALSVKLYIVVFGQLYV
jgi:hypothetical protein